MSTKGLVLITGANGYIASVTVGAFLEAGWTVRGAVRSMLMLENWRWLKYLISQFLEHTMKPLKVSLKAFAVKISK
jgi:nucleoside-diphosphate-sugar epimerase